MSTHTVAEAEVHLSELIDRALEGEGVVITRHGKPVVELFDDWVARWATRVVAQEADVREATAILRRLDLNIRACDALDIAIAMRLDAGLATLDEHMADNARALGASVAAA